MRPYGMPRGCFWLYPDAGDVAAYGLQSRHGRTRNKRATRRYFKRQARKAAKREIESERDHA